MSDEDVLKHRVVLLLVAGGIAAYRTPELVRRLQDRGATVRCVLTKGGATFVSPLVLAALSGAKVHQDLFSLTEEVEMGHIRLAREADLIVVAPATANLMAKMAVGLADDLASTILLAARGPILLAPSMNHAMWSHPATQDNLAILRRRGVAVVGPDDGALACGEAGIGRLVEIPTLVSACAAALAPQRGDGVSLAGIRALVTSGPTHEPIDPVRFIANRSSGKQGHAVAAALARRGADVALISGPTALPTPPGVRLTAVETAAQMLQACHDSLPVEVAVCVAAVADWRVDPAANKLKKQGSGAPPPLTLIPNPDILAALSAPGPGRPALVIGFAAETQALEANARAKLERKGCDWICANDVSPGTDVFGGDVNRLHLISRETMETWPPLAKTEVAERLVDRIADFFSSLATGTPS